MNKGRNVNDTTLATLGMRRAQWKNAGEKRRKQLLSGLMGTELVSGSVRGNAPNLLRNYTMSNINRQRILAAPYQMPMRTVPVQRRSRKTRRSRSSSRKTRRSRSRRN